MKWKECNSHLSIEFIRCLRGYVKASTEPENPLLMRFGDADVTHDLLVKRIMVEPDIISNLTDIIRSLVESLDFIYFNKF